MNNIFLDRIKIKPSLTTTVQAYMPTSLSKEDGNLTIIGDFIDQICLRKSEKIKGQYWLG